MSETRLSPPAFPESSQGRKGLARELLMLPDADRRREVQVVVGVVEGGRAWWRAGGRRGEGREGVVVTEGGMGRRALEATVEEEGGSAGEGSVRVKLLEGDNPRERLFRLGAAALTDPELLCMLLGGGARAQALAEELLGTRGGLKALVQEDPQELCRRPGVGPGRTAQVLAALELGRRAQRSPERRPRLRTPKDIYQYLAPSLSALRREVFHVLCFNARNVLLLDARVAEGTINACPVDPREVFAAAITVRATAIVLAHNHPSGDPEPSAQDLGLTSQLLEAGRLLGIKVLDHVVVGDGTYCSLLERGELPLGGASSGGPWNMAGERW